MAAADAPGPPLLAAVGLSRAYGARSAPRLALDGVSLELRDGGVLGVVGESGCGKSTLARVLAGLERPTSGRVLLRGRALEALPGGERRQVQMLFQDPGGSLDPRMPLGAAIAEGLPPLRAGDRHSRVAALLDAVGLTAAHASRFPHELSGGQRQRAALARALAVEPAVLIADEPFSALDASVRAQVAVLLDGLRRTRGMALLLLAHDLAAVAAIAEGVAVMLLGRLVETGSASDVLHRPRHPYTRRLLSAAMTIGGHRPRRADRPGATAGQTVPVPMGCPYAARCSAVRTRCMGEAPALRQVAPGRWAACHFPLEETPAGGP